jgi:quercetin dioxygenase-like cupin family protein
MPIERADDHPTYELGANRITSLIGPSRGSDEIAMFRTEVPPGSGLPPHRHDHIDAFTVLSGTVTFHLGDETVELREGDSAVVPIGVRHALEAGQGGALLMVTMVPGTRMIREDGSETVPPWVR